MKRSLSFFSGALIACFASVTSFALTPSLTTVTGGAFTMGSAVAFPDGLPDEYPTHTVTISTFKMGTYLVRWDEWQDVRTWGLNYPNSTSPFYPDISAGQGRGSDYPVTNISWYDAIKWCNALSEREGKTAVYRDGGGVIVRSGTPATVVADFSADGFRLPTEAEWEYAARGGETGGRFPGNPGATPAVDKMTISHARANYVASGLDYDTSGGANPPWTHPNTTWGAPAPGATSAPSTIVFHTNPVSAFGPNGHGLYDMAGNLWQWCWDLYHDRYYEDVANPVTDPRGPTSSSTLVPIGSGTEGAPTRVLRGGSWETTAFYLRVSNRAMDVPAHKLHGFRIAQKSP